MNPHVRGYCDILKRYRDSHLGDDLVVRAMPIDPRDQRWESDSPAYRVCFWQSAGFYSARGFDVAPAGHEWMWRSSLAGRAC